MEKIVLIITGFIALYFSGRFFIDQTFARKYVTESPKAYIWRKIFGIEKTMILTKYLFAPVGLALSLILIALALIK